MNLSQSKRPSPALIVSAIALTFALVGTSVAADPVAKLNAKKVKKIAKREISKAEPTLNVRNAKTADTATSAVNAVNALNAVSLTSQRLLNYSADPGTAATQVFSGGGLTISAACAAGPAITVTATTATDNATINSYGNNADTTDDDWDTGDTLTISGGDEGRQLVYTSASGAVVTIQYAADEGTIYGAPRCIAKGIAQIG